MSQSHIPVSYICMVNVYLQVDNCVTLHVKMMSLTCSTKELRVAWTCATRTQTCMGRSTLRTHSSQHKQSWPACSNLLLSLGLALLGLLGRLLLLLHQSLHLLYLFDQESTDDPTHKWLPKH